MARAVTRSFLGSNYNTCLTAGGWLSLWTTVSTTNITKILLKVALNTIALIQVFIVQLFCKRNSLLWDLNHVINRFNSVTFLCLSPTQNLDFQRHMSWSFFCVQWVRLRWKVIVRFVNIGEIDDDHHCLNFLCMIVMHIFSSIISWGFFLISNGHQCYKYHQNEQASHPSHNWTQKLPRYMTLKIQVLVLGGIQHVLALRRDPNVTGSPTTV